MSNSSIISFPDRGPWGKPRYRGNCSGHVYKDMFEQLRPNVFIDPTMGSGTSIEVATEMGIEAYGLDLNAGFNILRQSIFEAVGKPGDLVLSHFPYHDMIVYSGQVWGTAPHPDDLSRCKSEEEFLEKATVALLNQRHATSHGGYYGTIIGDLRRSGKYSSYQAEFIARLPKDELRAVIIKAQHNVQSDNKNYGHMKLPKIFHEYVILWERPNRPVSWLGTLAQLAHQADRRLRGTWKAIVWAALAQLGGRAKLEDLYAVIAQQAPEKLAGNPENWQPRVRATLQLSPDTFANEDRGVWALAA